MVGMQINDKVRPRLHGIGMHCTGMDIVFVMKLFRLKLSVIVGRHVIRFAVAQRCISW